MTKIMGEATAQKQSIVRANVARDDALEFAQSLQRHVIATSIVRTDQTRRVPVVNSLLQWLVSLANLSDGLCRLICEEVRHE